MCCLSEETFLCALLLPFTDAILFLSAAGEKSDEEESPAEKEEDKEAAADEVRRGEDPGVFSQCNATFRSLVFKLV